jgi:hypothetical protein
VFVTTVEPGPVTIGVELLVVPPELPWEAPEGVGVPGMLWVPSLAGRLVVVPAGVGLPGTG